MMNISSIDYLLFTFIEIEIKLFRIPSLVRFLDISYFQYPSSFFWMDDNHSMIFCYYMSLYGQYRLRIDTQPSDLKR